MKKLLENHISCNLMVWETQQVKRNINNEVKFLVASSLNVNIGDTIIGNYSGDSVSYYEITEIKSRRPSSTTGKDYLIAETKWSNKQVNFSEYDLTNVSTAFKNAFNLM